MTHHKPSVHCWYPAAKSQFTFGRKATHVQKSSCQTKQNQAMIIEYQSVAALWL